MFDTTKTLALKGDQVESLLVGPVVDTSITTRITNVLRTTKHRVRFPKLVTDVTAHWTAEGDEITPSTPEFGEVTAETSKVAGLTIVTNEMLDDAEDYALNQIGDGLRRQIVGSIDKAFFTAVAAPAPQGLTSITPTVLDVGTELTNLDWAQEATALAASVGSTINHFVANPDDVLALALLKESTGSNRGLLQPNPAQPTISDINGIPLIASTDVTAGTIWGIPKDTVHTVVRKDAEVKSDGSVMFTSDRTAIRGVMRVGFAFTHEAGIIKVNHGAAG